MSATLAPSAPLTINWQRPDYNSILAQRLERLRRLRERPELWAPLKLYYRDSPVDFLNHWAMSFDPRNPEVGQPAITPFIPFPKQAEWLNWTHALWRSQESGITEKSRESGMSWLMLWYSIWLCVTHTGVVVGMGSRKEEYVDQRGNMKSLFEKARFGLNQLPLELLDGWERDKHSPHMRIMFPGTGSALTGEAGDGIGRGDRTSIYFLDEAAFLERPELIDAALSHTTRCRIDISTPCGMANSFAIRRHSGKFSVFTFSWQHDPRKGPDWYGRMSSTLDDVTLAQEVDISYSASARGIVIPQIWVQAAIGAHLKLGIEPTGRHYSALDIADQGADLCSFAGRHGILLQHLESWSGKGSDTYASVVQTINLCERYGYREFDYDADGMGALVRGDARVINEAREAVGKPSIRENPFRGSASPINPDGSLIPGRKNKDYFANLKAMSWWALRLRFRNTYRAVVEKQTCDADEIISIDARLPELALLCMELSQPTWSENSVGKILIDKTPDGAKSPNRADAVMIVYNPSSRLGELWAKLGSQPGIPRQNYRGY